MTDNIVVEEVVEHIGLDFELPPNTNETKAVNEPMDYEQLENLKTLIKCAKRMNKGGYKKCIPNGIRGLLFKGKAGQEKAVTIDPQIWTAFLKYDIRLNVETPF